MPDQFECTPDPLVLPSNDSKAPCNPESSTPLAKNSGAYPPARRLLRAGAGALSDAELLGLLLRGGRKSGGKAVQGSCLAHELLKTRGGLAGLLHSSAADLEMPGLGAAKRAVVLATLELGRRLAKAQLPPTRVLRRIEKLVAYLRLRFDIPQQETMGALFLDTAHRLLAEDEFFRGTLDRACVEPRGILRRALIERATGFVIFHTHPSGDPAPTAEDLDFTRRLAAAGEILGVRMIDHLIIGRNGRWVSMRQRGGWR